MLFIGVTKIILRILKIENQTEKASFGTVSD